MHCSKTSIFRRWVVLILFGIVVWEPVRAQQFEPIIQRAWQNNEQLKAKEFSLQAAEFSLQEAKALYGPQVSFGTQYTLASGGREIDFPIGDLLNPVYSSLNALTQSQQFPQLENQMIDFLPHNFYDARFRIQQPIYQPELAINRELQVQKIESHHLEIKAFKRMLSKEVMDALLNYQKAATAVQIFEEAQELLQEAYRTTNSLVRNGKLLPQELRRIDSEMAKIEAQKIQASNQVDNAKAYAQFIVGDSLQVSWIQELLLPELPDPLFSDPALREELQQFNNAMDQTNLAIRQQDLFYKPRIGAQLDLGSQDFNFGINPYVLFGLNIQVNVFDNQAHKHKKAQAKAQLLSLEANKDYVTKQLELQTDLARNDLQAAIRKAGTYRQQIQAAASLFEDALAQQKQGTINTLDLIDAQTQVTQSELEYTIARYDAWLKWSAYQYAAAVLPIE